jgi:hypothetical protein
MWLTRSCNANRQEYFVALPNDDPWASNLGGKTAVNEQWNGPFRMEKFFFPTLYPPGYNRSTSAFLQGCLP